VKAARDIVQFVKFNDFKLNPERLEQEVLKEIPAQMTQFMSMMKIAPQQKKPLPIPPPLPRKVY
jgi:hypothetical protein